jgi:hypothetical protein
MPQFSEPVDQLVAYRRGGGGGGRRRPSPAWITYQRRAETAEQFEAAKVADVTGPATTSAVGRSGATHHTQVAIDEQNANSG